MEKRQTIEDQFNLEQYVNKPIPAVDPKIKKEFFEGMDKKWKKIPISEQITETTKSHDMTVAYNSLYDNFKEKTNRRKGEVMGRPAYYKNPKLPENKSGLGELAKKALGRLQRSPIVHLRKEVKEKLILDPPPKWRGFLRNRA